MLVSYNWIKDYVDIESITPDVLGEHFTLTGLEVEEVKHLGTGLENIVIGKVVSCEPIPDTKLSLTQVEVGDDSPAQIVCGAPNIAEGQKVIVALPGAVLPGGVEIQKTEIQGYESNGMISSLQELGYPESVISKDYVDGIYVLPEEAEVGADVRPLLGLDDVVYDIDLTPNRADALSMRGIAHEVGAITSQVPQMEEVEVLEASEKSISDFMDVLVEDETDAPIYSIRVIENVTVKESPMWLQRKLMNAGMRPIDNLVDVTNYIMLEYGQPLHAFDMDKIDTNRIHVRRAEEGEKLETLDGKERILTTEDIVITNGEQPIALAGVMGGANSDISENSQTVALEAAVFNPVNIRRTAQRLNLRSEASARFEKGINTSTVIAALDHAAALLAELGGGEVVGGIAGTEKVDIPDTEIPVSVSYLEAVIGVELGKPVIFDILERLGFKCENDPVNEDKLTLHVPARRWDIKIPADVAEEVARIYGYNNIPSTLPVGDATPGKLTEKQQTIRHTNRFLEGCGLNQAINYSLTTKSAANQFALSEGQDTSLDWPMSEEHQTLRKSLIPGLLESAQYNRARNMRDVFLYETGRVYNAIPGQTLLDEDTHVGGILVGSLVPSDWIDKESPVDFFTVKGIVEKLFESYGLVENEIYGALTTKKGMHPGRTAAIYLNDVEIGFLGQVHPKVAAKYDLEETYVFEFDLEAVLTVETTPRVAQEIAKYPGTTRDIALLIDEAVTHQEVMEVISEAAGSWLKSVTIFDYYQGGSIEEGMKSVAYSLFYQNPNATLVEETVTEEFNRVKDALKNKLNAEIR